MKIGVFDSGVGGENVVLAIRQALPDAQVIFKDDRTNLPYGDKTPEQLLVLVEPIISSFVQQDNVDAIVIACNTVSTNILPEIKAMVTVPVVGFVPMIKPAGTMSKTGSITVCATPGTLQSKRYDELKKQFAQNIQVVEPDCSDWAALIESSELSTQRLQQVIDVSRSSNSDVIVLGCTHYHWIESKLRELAGPDIQVIQPTDAVVAELIRVTSQPVS